MVDRFGAYISHLTPMTEDSSVVPAGKKKMKAYIKKWQGSKVLLLPIHTYMRPTHTAFQKSFTSRIFARYSEIFARFCSF